MSRDRSTGWKNGKIDNMVGLVDILNEYIFWLVDIWKNIKDLGNLRNIGNLRNYRNVENFGILQKCRRRNFGNSGNNSGDSGNLGSLENFGIPNIWSA